VTTALVYYYVTIVTIFIRQVSLLRAHAGEHLLLSAAHRSLPYSDVVLLGNDTVLSRNVADPAIARLVVSVIDDVISVLRDVGVDDVELACLKAVIFFDPGQYKSKHVTTNLYIYVVVCIYACIHSLTHSISLLLSVVLRYMLLIY